MFFLPDKLDLQKFSKEDLLRIHMITYETIMCDEISQITGVVHFADFKGIPSSVITLIPPVEFYRIVKWSEVSRIKCPFRRIALEIVLKVLLTLLQQSLPLRHKEMIFANAPAPLRYVYDFFKSILSKKLQTRTKVSKTVNLGNACERQ